MIQPSIEQRTSDRCPLCKSRELSPVDDRLASGRLATCGSCGWEGDEAQTWPSFREMGIPADYCGACGRRRLFGCGHQPHQELEIMRSVAIGKGEPDPVTGAAFTSAQRSHWIESGDVVDVNEVERAAGQVPLDIRQRIAAIIAESFPGGQVVERRRDPDEPGWFVMIDDPADEFEYVEIYVNADGSWEA